MKYKVLFLIIFSYSHLSFSQKWLKNFYTAYEITTVHTLKNKKIINRLIRSFSTSSLEAKKVLRALDIPPKDIQIITSRFTLSELIAVSKITIGLSPKTTKVFFSDLARYNKTDRIQNLIEVIKKDPRVLDSYERVCNHLGPKFRTNIGVLIQIANQKSPIKIKTTISQKHKSYYKKKLVSVNGLVFEGYFPDFKKQRKFFVSLPKNLIIASDEIQMKYATKKIREAIRKNPSLRDEFSVEQLKAIDLGKRKIAGLTWHHKESPVGAMELLPQKIHDEVKHDGGNIFWGGGIR